MSRGYLTIDDAPTKITPKIVDYLSLRGITPVINFIGEKVEKYFEEAVYAVKKGAIIGNHSFTHPHFSKLTLEECREEIRKTEEEINKVYKAACKERKYRVFRFPYGDKGGDNYSLFQKVLKEEFKFDRLDDTKINFPWWKENNLDTDVDMMWTFDFIEYQLSWNNGYTWDSIVERILDKHPEMGGVLLEEGSMHIVLMHDTAETDEVLHEYYKKIIDCTLLLGIWYVKPKFIMNDL